jgi:hypothetical protein
MLWFYLLPLSYILYLLVRLTKNQSLYKRALKRSALSFSSPEKFLECLQDDEILLFAAGKEAQIPKNSLRWEQIFLLFKDPN